MLQALSTRATERGINCNAQEHSGRPLSWRSKTAVAQLGLLRELAPRAAVVGRAPAFLHHEELQPRRRLGTTTS